MNEYTGKFLKSTGRMDDPVFRDTILYIAEHNEQGVLAFIINQVFERPLNELAEFSGSPAFPLYCGGPVDQEHLFFVHCRADIIPGGEQISDGLYLGGHFAKAIEHINEGTLTKAGIKIFIGYSGWDSGELEAEITEGCWEIISDMAERVFDYDDSK